MPVSDVRIEAAPPRARPPGFTARGFIAHGFNANVHGARGAFAFAVFVFHVANSRLPTAPWLATGLPYAFAMSLQFGVELFFCISGYVISGTVRRADNALSFLRDRALRIFPVLWASMPFVILLEYIGHEPVVMNLTTRSALPLVAANLLCLPTILPLPLLHYAAWSLSYEMAFYTMAALGWWLWSRWRPLIALNACAMALVLSLYPRAVFFLPGLLVAEGLLASTLVKRLSRFPTPFLLLFLAAWWQAARLDGGDVYAAVTAWSPAHWLLAGVALAGACIGFQGIADGSGWLGRALRTRALQFLGTISYSLYLWQFLTMAVVKHAMLMLGFVSILGAWAQAAFFVLALPPTIAVAWISQRALERGVSRWLGRRLGARKAAARLERQAS